MMLHRFSALLLPLVMLLAANTASAAAVKGTAPVKNDQPIQVSSDKLDVFQNENKAIFTGNVIATQGTTNMRSQVMTVFYRGGSNDAAPAPTAGTESPQGIHRIEAEGKVVFTTPEETAIGDTAVYNVDTDTIDVLGANVTLTRGQNILKGTTLNYNMTTGRSVLTGGGTTRASDGSVKPTRVHGLFVPKSKEAP
jgi:lipopolysaccharide export system protein LptA